jgi:lipopolysaccharide biosynthesis glycosyltransferase
VTKPRRTIVFGSDDDYIEPMLVALTSLADPGGLTADDVDVAVLHRELGVEQRRRIALVAERLGLDVEPIEVAEDVNRYPLSHWVSAAAYLRLSLDRGTRGASEIVYLDCDLIAVAPVGELLTVKPGPLLAAAVDITHPTVGSGHAIPGFEALGIPPTRRYFNSGVMVIDVAAWELGDISDRCRRFLVDHPEHVMYWDQDALNVVVDDRWTCLEPELNAIALGGLEGALRERGDDASLRMLKDATDIESRATILHFAGPLKPWNPVCPDFPARDRYLDQARRLADIERGRARL